MTSALITDWQAVLLSSSTPPGLSPVGWYIHVEWKNIIHSYVVREMERGGDAKEEPEELYRGERGERREESPQVGRKEENKEETDRIE